MAVYRKIGEEEKYIGTPDGDTMILKGDTLICYGPEKAIRNLSQRLKGKRGDKQHKDAIEEEKIRKERELKELEEK